MKKTRNCRETNDIKFGELSGFSYKFSSSEDNDFLKMNESPEF